jgi:hypothetical protein
MKNALLLLFVMAIPMAGCAKSSVGQSSGKSSSSGLTLHLEQNEGRAYVYVVNGGKGSFSINRLFRIWGSDAEITFLFPKGVGEERKLITRGIPHIPSPKDSVMSLEPYTIYGRYYDLEIIQEIYQLKPGCYMTKVAYKNKVNDLDVDAAEIVSDGLKICFN